MKKILIAALLVFPVSYKAVSQVAIQWQKTYGGDNFDYTTALQQTSDHGFIVGGYSYSGISGDKTQSSRGSFDYWILKLDSAGVIQWQKDIGGNAWDELHCLQQTSDGGYILGGLSQSNISGDKTENDWGGNDIWIIKTDASGSIQWQKDIGGTNGDALTCVKQTSDGGYILGANSNSGISGNKTDSCRGGYDYWIIKLDASGTIQWQKTIGGTDNDQVTSISQTSDGGYIAGGISRSNISGEKTENSRGWDDYWIIKLDASGTIQWQKTFGGSQFEYSPVVHQTSDGGYIIGGTSFSLASGDKTSTLWGEIDYWILKTDASGSIQWQKDIGGSASDQLKHINQTSDGGFIIAGQSNSQVSGDKTENTWGSDDYWLMKTDGSGNIQWQESVGGSDQDFLVGSDQAADGGFILGGYTRSGISGDKNESCRGNYDYWLVKVTGDFNSIRGKLFIDANSNLVQDAGEPSVILNRVTEANTGAFSFSRQNGSYEITVLDTGNYSVLPTPVSNFTAVPATQNAYFPSMNLVDSLNDFAFQPISLFNDLCLTITPLSLIRRNHFVTYMMSYTNDGTVPLTPTITFYPDTAPNFISTSPAASYQSPDSIVWNLPIIYPTQTSNVFATFQIPLSLPIGLPINCSARIDPVAGDVNPACNYAVSLDSIVFAYDPNQITVDRNVLLTDELDSVPFLEYIVLFQKVGTDTAFNVRIQNEIDPLLDVNTFEWINSSSPANITYNPFTRIMEFRFDNILLPDSNINEAASHGLLQYRIKPYSTLSAGDSIINTASIFFDFNLPVNTNNAITQVIAPEYVFPISSEQHLSVFPNPTSSVFTVRFSNAAARSVELRNMLGEQVWFERSNSSEVKIDAGGLSQGAYFIIVHDDRSNFTSRLIKL
jgi:hypothetical protein